MDNITLLSYILYSSGSAAIFFLVLYKQGRKKNGLDDSWYEHQHEQNIL